MNSNKKRKRKRTGTSLVLAACLVGVLLVCAALAGAEETYGVIGGSVFRETGHAFPGVPVQLTPLKPSKKWKVQKAVTNGRGEYAFRVPAAEMEFDLAVKIDGYRPETKRVKIVGEERIDQNFLLEKAR